MANNGDHMQALIAGLSMQWQRDRAETQMTLGKLIEQLAAMPPEMLIDGICHPDSYRGYYSDLAFVMRPGRRSVADVLKECREQCMGQVFTGYKGGDYVMGAMTPLWIAEYGSCGERIMSLDSATGVFTLASDE